MTLLAPIDRIAEKLPQVRLKNISWGSLMKIPVTYYTQTAVFFHIRYLGSPRVTFI